MKAGPTSGRTQRERTKVIARRPANTQQSTRAANMSQQQKPKSSIQPIQDVLDKGVELGGAWPLPFLL
jgi:hypothetical protein